MRIWCVAFIVLALSACSDIAVATYDGPPRTFASSFESVSDFADFYSVPSGDWDSSHTYASELVHSGTFAHRATIDAPRADDNDGLTYRPHRAYPTIQLHKTADGVFRTPCLVTVWVNLDMALLDRPTGHVDDWFSFLTLTPDQSDNWNRTVLLNLTPDGYAKLVHVPRQGEQDRTEQVTADNDPTGALLFPLRQWVRFDVYIDFDADHGQAIAWQDGVRVSAARVEGGAGALAQAHFGLYAAAAVPRGTIVNDDLTIRELSDDEAAALLGSND